MLSCLIKQLLTHFEYDFVVCKTADTLAIVSMTCERAKVREIVRWFSQSRLESNPTKLAWLAKEDDSSRVETRVKLITFCGFPRRIRSRF